MQFELAQRVGIYCNMLGRYERSEACPFVEMAAKLAEALGVSLDYLVVATELEVDTNILQKIQQIQQLPEKDWVSHGNIYFICWIMFYKMSKPSRVLLPDRRMNQ